MAGSGLVVKQRRPNLEYRVTSRDVLCISEIYHTAVCCAFYAHLNYHVGSKHRILALCQARNVVGSGIQRTITSGDGEMPPQPPPPQPAGNDSPRNRPRL
jgi:hypothetical protein